MRVSWRRAAGLLALWSLPAIVVAGQLYVQLDRAGREPSWSSLLLIQLFRWWPWAALTPWIQQRARDARVAWTRSTSPQADGPVSVRWRRYRATAPLIALAVALLPATNAWNLFVDLVLFQGIAMDTATWVTRVAAASVVNLPVFVVVFGGIVATTLGADLWSEHQRRQVEAQRLRSDLAEARLQALQLQLQPHFLFNTLHAISSLMDEDVARARRMTAKLGELLRATLDLADAAVVPLREEVGLAELYLAIEQTRFEDRLRVEWAIEPETFEALVPTLCLQPLVENAIRHGVAARRDAGWVSIRAARLDTGLRIDVEDDGGGPPKEPRFGVGLSNIASRLEQRYGRDAAKLSLRQSPTGGCLASITLPWET